ncbi:hypothetical protein KQ51_01442 [Candidatus Izimaplasma bacterium HR1]|jgi:hypothetical protein|uniref:hypothetical protein n=1 Tax=Candidatus Izimoplasma sp. HR1 TaxID=1541959 RepID=UPI0004F71DC3|nr:hypothetical protein KQ51_01442 [Candidatus Izimaplasma bacterium HR1]
MSKDSFLRLYTKLSIFIGFVMFIFVAFFVGRLGIVYKSLLEANIFGIKVLIMNNEFVIVNTPLIIFSSLLLLNIYMLIRVGNTKDVKQKFLQNVVFNNTFLVLLMIVGQIAFVLMMPDNINDPLVNRFVMITFYTGTNNPYNVIFTSYILTLVYFIYNIVVSVKSPGPKLEETEEVTPSYYTSNDVEALIEETEEVIEVKE